jgi:hypothetical protein
VLVTSVKLVDFGSNSVAIDHAASGGIWFVYAAILGREHDRRLDLHVWILQLSFIALQRTVAISLARQSLFLVISAIVSYW